MTLIDDVNAGLAAVSTPDATTPLVLDEHGRCEITAPMPPGLDGVPDQVTIMVSATDSGLTLRAPLAALDGDLGAAAGAALLRRQFFPDQSGGISYAIADAEDVLVAIYHWVVGHVSTDDFTELLSHFITIWVDMVGEVAGMADAERSIRML
jgi:hypothetical protein